jgi:hypothetical protein
MKKIHVLGIGVLAMLVVGIMSVASASAAEWLANGAVIGAAKASTTTGEILLRNTNAGGLGLNVEVLCSGSFDGTVGPGKNDTIEKVLSLSGVEVTLAAPLACTNEANCSSPQVSAVGLPWKTELTSLTTDKITTATAGWEIDCTTIFGLIEETCTGSVTSKVSNSGAEVLGSFSEAEIIAKGEQATCTGGGGKTGTVNSDTPGKITLNSGETLAVS